MTGRNLLLLVLAGLIISVMLVTSVAIAESTDGETDVYYEENTSSPSVHLLNSPSSVYESDELEVTIGWSNIPTDWELIISLEKSEANKDRLADDVNRTISGSGEATFKLNVYPVNETYNQTRIWACLIDDNKEWANVFTDIGIIVLPALPPQPTTAAPSIHILNSPYSVNGSTELDVTVGWNNIPTDWELIISLEKSGTDKNRLADDVNRIVSGSEEATFKLNVYPVDETYNQTRICAYLLDDDREWANVFTDIGIIVIPALPPQPQPSTFILPEYMLAATLFLAALILIKSRKKTIAVPPSIKPVPTVPPESASDLAISRETEFYQGYIRFKMSVTNTSFLVVNDVALDFDFDDDLLRMDRHEPDYQIKNGKIILGNISGESSKTVAVHFDPMMCSKGTNINCQINYKDAKGQLQTTWMEPKKISVVCPIMQTNSDINIGRLKEFIEKLPHSDSKVYQLQTGFAIDKLKNSCREVIQKHDVKHIRTLSTKDGKACELWYYGKTKVNSYDIVIRVTLVSETQSIELFAATQTAESLTGLLAEVGRELKSAIEDRITGNVQQVINVSIKDSIIQRSNLLSYCDINGNCSGDVVIEDSLVTRSEIGLDVGGDFCPACGEVVQDGVKFCNECGERL